MLTIKEILNAERNFEVATNLNKAEFRKRFYKFLSNEKTYRGEINKNSIGLEKTKSTMEDGFSLGKNHDSEICVFKGELIEKNTKLTIRGKVDFSMTLSIMQYVFAGLGLIFFFYYAYKSNFGKGLEFLGGTIMIICIENIMFYFVSRQYKKLFTEIARNNGA